jgi:membrane protease YdiL (CAAX protease family)
MEWVIVVALLLGVPLSVWMYTRAFRRVYLGQEAMVTVTQYGRLDAAIALVVSLCLMSPMLLASSGGKTGDPISVDAQLILVGYLLFYGTLLLVIVASLVLRRIKLGDIFRFGKMPVLHAVRCGFVFLLFAAPVVFAADFLGNWLNARQDPQGVITLVGQSTSAQRVPLLLTAMIAAPIAEEFVFRGYLYSAAKRFLGGVPALLLTGSVFAVVHANVPSLLPLFLLACCLTIAYETTGNLWVCVTMHSAFNALNIVISLPQS